MSAIELTVIALAIGNVIGIAAAYTLGRSAGIRWGYAQGLRVADAWKRVYDSPTRREK